MIYSSDEHFLRLQLATECKLEEFTRFLELAVCKRCWAQEHHRWCRPSHTHGGFLEMIAQFRLTRELIKKWALDTEHGLLHGLMVLFFAYFLTPERDYLFDTVLQYNGYKEDLPRIKLGDILIGSCLFHDLCKIEGQHDGHDAALREIYSGFDEATYHHTNPGVDYELNPIVGGDRIELLRYPDHTTWCHMETLEPYINQFDNMDIVFHIYNHIRPMLEKTFRHRWDIWVSHVLETTWEPMESMSDNRGCPHFPRSHWYAADPGYAHHAVVGTELLFSVNIGKLPNDQCLTHTPTNNCPRGLISLTSLREHGCDIQAAPNSTCGRDHPFVINNTNLPVNSWCFTYNQPHQIKIIDNEACNILHEHLFNRIFQCSESIITKMLALSVIR